MSSARPPMTPPAIAAVWDGFELTSVSTAPEGADESNVVASGGGLVAEVLELSTGGDVVFKGGESIDTDPAVTEVEGGSEESVEEDSLVFGSVGSDVVVLVGEEAEVETWGGRQRSSPGSVSQE
jgi:hypothetical protein